MISSPTAVASARQIVRELVVLFKLRIVALLLFSAIAAAILAAQGWPGWGAMAIVIASVTSSAAGASALNEYLERERDALMNRTHRRPLVSGTLANARWVPAVGITLIATPIVVALPSNPLLALWLFAGAFTYVVIYTLWLKPRTSLNIVIGGASGSAIVLSGAAVVGASGDKGVLLLAALVFLWTPIHFWSLAMVYRDDYARAGIPMLPVRSSPRLAAILGLAHGAGASAAGLAMAFSPTLGPVFAGIAILSSGLLLAQGLRLVFDPSRKNAWRLFHASNLYLFAILVAIVIAVPLGIPWP